MPARKWLPITVVVCLSSGAAFPFSECIATWEPFSFLPRGFALFLHHARELLFLPQLYFLLVMLVALFFIFTYKWRKWSVIRLVYGTLFTLSLGGGMICGMAIRHEAFERLAARSQPIIDAIPEYEERFNRLPFDLENLVPHVLEEIPKTGMAAYPVYRFRDLTEVDQEHHGNRWMLWVSCPISFLNFDEFIYLPNMAYPQAGFGGSLERIGDWAYVHE